MMGFFKEFFTEIAVRVKNPGNNKYSKTKTTTTTITTTTRTYTPLDLSNPTKPVTQFEPVRTPHPRRQQIQPRRQTRRVEPDLRRAWLLD
jgi:hypothetical protein